MRGPLEAGILSPEAQRGPVDSAVRSASHSVRRIKASIRSAVTGAAVVPVEVIRRMREELKIRTVVTGYGMTETTGTISMCRFDDPPEVVANTVGRPLSGVEVRVMAGLEVRPPTRT